MQVLLLSFDHVELPRESRRWKPRDMIDVNVVFVMNCTEMHNRA
jgi:hypothetical protein